MDNLKEAFEHRRAVNFFDKNRKLDDKTLHDIINLAVLAPSAFNLQPWEIIAVKSQEAKEKLHSVAMKQPKILEAPVTLIIIGDREGYMPSNPAWNVMEEAIGTEAVKNTQKSVSSFYETSEEMKVKFAEANCGLLSMSIMYAAQYYGVESHPMTGVNFAELKKEFNLKESQEAVMLISLGYFDQSHTLYPRSRRRGYSEIVKEV